METDTWASGELCATSIRRRQSNAAGTTRIVNVLAKLPKRQQDQAKLMLRTIPYAPTRTEAERLRTVFTRWCGDHSYEAASEALERDWDRMVTFYDFPKEHWGHLRHDEPGRITPSRPSGFGPMPPSATRGSIGR